MLYITGSLGPTASYSRREYAYLDYGNDGRKGTIFLNIWHAERRHNTAVFTSSYSVGEVPDDGTASRVFLMDKLTGDDEHPRKPGDRLPPYRIRVQDRTNDDGEVHTFVTCDCMGATCNAPSCRHTDLIRELIDQGAFEGDTLSQGGYDDSYVPTTFTDDRRRLPQPSEEAQASTERSRGEVGRFTPNGDPLVQGGTPHRRSNSPFDPQAHRQVANNSENSVATAIDSQVTICHINEVTECHF